MFLPAKAPCWNFPNRGGNGTSQREHLPQGLLFLLSPIFHCHRIKDGDHNNTNTNKVSPTQIRPHCRLHHLIASHFPYVFLSLAKSSYIPSVSLHFISSFIISSHLIVSRHILSKLFTSRLIKPNVQVLHVRLSQLLMLLRKRKY